MALDIPLPSMVPSGRWMRIGGALLVACTAIGLLFARTLPDSYDAGIMLHVTESLVENGEITVDDEDDFFGYNSPYSFYGIGMSLLFAVPYAVGKLFGDPLAGAMTTNALLFGTVAAVLCWYCRLAAATWRQAVTASLLVATGTSLLAYTATGFSEIAVALSITLGLVAIQAARRGRRWAPVVAGAAAGLSLVLRTDSAVLIIPVVAVGIWVGGERSRRSIVGFVAGFAPFFVLWAAYNQARYGAPWRLGYQVEEARFSAPFIEGFHGLTVAPGKGVVWYAPLIAVAAVGTVWGWRRDRVVTAAAVVFFAGRLLLFSRWWAWEGGVAWGPRFVVPGMAAFVVGVLEVVRRYPTLGRAAKAAVVAVATVSIAVQIVGAAVRYEIHFNEFAVPRAVGPERSVDFYLFDWDESPIVGEARYLLRGHALTGRFLEPHVEPAPLAILVATALVSLVLARRWARAADGDDGDGGDGADRQSATRQRGS